MKESKTKWYNNIKILWSAIGVLITALTAFIIYNKTLIADLNSLERDLIRLNNIVDRIENSELRIYREWKWELESILVRHEIIKYEAGIMKDAK